MRNKSSYHGIGESMGYGSVYYKSLLQSNNPQTQLNTFTTGALTTYEKVKPSWFTSIGLSLLKQSANEYQKEINVLTNIFHSTHMLYLDQSANWEEELINAINYCLQFEEVLKRVLSHYHHGNTKATDYFDFGRHMKSAWDDHSSELFNLINPNDTAETLTYKFENFIKNIIIPDAIQRFSQIGVSFNYDSSEDIGSLNQFYDMINNTKFQGRNTLINQLYQEYKLDQIAQDLSLNINNKNLTTTDIQNKATWATHDNLRGGNIGEYFSQAMMASLVQGLSEKYFNFPNAKAFGSGKLKTKDDIIFACNVNFKYLNKLFSTEEKVSRERNVKMMKDLDNILRNIKNGYIVHVSEKDYGKGTYRKRGGFQAEKDVSLGTFRNINLRNKGIDMNAPLALIGAICQTLEGAIYENERDTLITALASQIGSFLFDDILNLGQSMSDLKGSRGHEIHLFYLSGIYVPLSTLLHRLGMAFIQNAKDIPNWVQVEVTLANKGRIKYWDEEQEYLDILRHKSSLSEEDTEIWEKGMWKEQRLDVLNNSKIKAHFYKGIDDLFNLVHL